MNLILKKKIYSLLFSKPLFEYATESGTKNKLDILILGENEDAVEAFKAVYWCCQMSDAYDYSITLASINPEKTKHSFCKLMPALLNNDVIETPIKFVCFGALDDTFYGYVFAFDAPNETVMQISRNTSGKKQLICLSNVFDDFNMALTDMSEVVDLKEESLFKEESKTLDRYAYNCDYAYSMGKNERCAKKSYDDFICVDSACVDEEMAGKYYNYLSSLAFPVHIPYKLQMCCDRSQYSKEQQMQLLMTCIKEKNELYYKLLDAEHRRWSAYMICEGWRMPDENELLEYAFVDYGKSGGFDQRDKKRKLHPCLCKGSDKYSNLDNYPDIWKEFYYHPKYTLSEARKYLDENYECQFSDLEAVSLVLYSIICMRCEDANNTLDEYFKFIDKLPYNDENRKIYEHLSESSKKLRNNEPNSSKLFSDSLNEALIYAAGSEIENNILKIQQDFKPLLERNKQKNYFTIDSTMIDMIPFSIWYGIKNKVIVTFSNGMAADDVIVPTLLCAEKALFVGSGMTDKYKESIRRYFSGRHILIDRCKPADDASNTAVDFIELNRKTQEHVSEVLEEIVKDNPGVSINCMGNNDTGLVMAIGALADKYDVPIYQYTRENGLSNIKNGSLISPGLTRKSFSLDEYINLIGGEYTNIYKMAPYMHEMELMEKIFIEYAPFEYMSSGKKKLYSAWSVLSAVSNESGKKQLFEINDRYGKEHYSSVFDLEVFSTCGIDYFLRQLDRFRIISDLKITLFEDKGLASAKFFYYDSGLKDFLSFYDHEHTQASEMKNRCLETKLTFTTANKNIMSTIGLNADNVQLFSSEEQEEVKERKKALLNILEESGFIRDLSFTKNDCNVSFKVKDFTILKNLKNQGNIFEIILYNKFRYSGLFDDVQTGVRISWSTSGKTLDDYILENLSEKFYGWNSFKKAHNIATSRFSEESVNFDTNNEIDVVFMKYMTPTFISCKTEKPENVKINGWLYEISSIANHFNANAALALTIDLDKNPASVCINRAKHMGVSIIGTETIFSETRMNKAIAALAEGKKVYGNETI